MSEPPRTDELPASGVAFAVACYGIWGLVPIYWKGIPGISAEETLIPRILWTLVIVWVASRLTGRMSETWRATPRDWAWTLLAALLLAGNWSLFIYAIQIDQVLATSLGYYINPLMSILLGLLILGERLNRVQSLAVLIAALGVAAITIREGELPWISLALAASFALYGLLHKLRPQPPLAGLTREMFALAPLVLIALGYLFSLEHSPLIDAGPADHAYLALSGVVTATPLLLFHAATKRLPLVAVGMFQYIAPTMTLALATFLYGEDFTPGHAIGFAFVWLGLILFSVDSIRRANANRIAAVLRADTSTP